MASTETQYRFAWRGPASLEGSDSKLHTEFWSDDSQKVFVLVMSASVKPRLAGRQPSNRGGALPGYYRVRSQAAGKCGSAMTGP
jgi:hypothetical protein